MRLQRDSTRDSSFWKFLRLRRFLRSHCGKHLFVFFSAFEADLVTVAGPFQMAAACVWLAAIRTVHCWSTTGLSVVRIKSDLFFNLTAVF